MRYLAPASLAMKELPALRRPLAPGHDAAALAQLLGVMREFRPHIVHTHMAKAGVGSVTTPAGDFNLQATLQEALALSLEHAR